LELIKDYDLDIQYHPGKANLVADALSWKGQANTALAFQLPDKLMKELRDSICGWQLTPRESLWR
jgi:hypothetical protein